jgi:homocitrate synthase
MKRIELIDTTLRDGQQSPLLFDAQKYKFHLKNMEIEE